MQVVSKVCCAGRVGVWPSGRVGVWVCEQVDAWACDMENPGATENFFQGSPACQRLDPSSLATRDVAQKVRIARAPTISYFESVPWHTVALTPLHFSPCSGACMYKTFTMSAHAHTSHTPTRKSRHTPPPLVQNPCRTRAETSRRLVWTRRERADELDRRAHPSGATVGCI